MRGENIQRNCYVLRNRAICVSAEGISRGCCWILWKFHDFEGLFTFSVNTKKKCRKFRQFHFLFDPFKAHPLGVLWQVEQEWQIECKQRDSRGPSIGKLPRFLYKWKAPREASKLLFLCVYHKKISRENLMILLFFSKKYSWGCREVIWRQFSELFTFRWQFRCWKLKIKNFYKVHLTVKNNLKILQYLNMNIQVDFFEK